MPERPVSMKTLSQDDHCYVRLADVVAWLERQGDCPADQMVEWLREAGQLWSIERAEFWPRGIEVSE